MFSKDVELREKREALKNRLIAGEYKTLIDVLLAETGQLMQKLIRSPKPPSFWYSGLVINLTALAISLLIIPFQGRASEFRIVVGLAAAGTGFGALIAGKLCFDAVYATLRDKLVEAIEAETDLQHLQYWLAGLNNQKKALIFSLGYVILIGFYSFVRLRESFFAVGAVQVLITGFQGGVFISTTSVSGFWPYR